MLRLLTIPSISERFRPRHWLRSKARQTWLALDGHWRGLRLEFFAARLFGFVSTGATMHPLMARIVARATNWALTRLRGGVDWNLSSEELRLVNLTFSVFGEDMAVRQWVSGSPDVEPFYVDVGCFDPILHSNTLFLHKLGWRGLNIDMQEEKIARFRNLRPKDVSVVAVCSDRIEDALCLEYGRGETDRIAPTTRPDLRSVIGEHPASSRRIRTTTLDEVLSRHGIERIGYLNIDCEGYDLKVLRGLALDRYRPGMVTIESTAVADDAEIRAHLSNAGYKLWRTYFRTLVFTRSQHAPNLLSE